MHTPGPWEIVSEFVGPLHVRPKGQAWSIAHVGHDDFATCEANAALIAAAPALYETESKLCAEVSGLLDLYEEGMRALMGNTNFNVLKLRYDEARAALSAAKAQQEKP